MKSPTDCVPKCVTPATAISVFSVAGSITTPDDGVVARVSPLRGFPDGKEAGKE
jgi:hypothetical protein